MPSPNAAYSQAQVRAIERAAIAAGHSGYALMQRAAAASLATLNKLWPAASRIVVVCGAGNNGGDGLVLARLAAAQGLTVRVLQQGISEQAIAAARVVTQSGAATEAQQALADYLAAGMTLQEFTATALPEADVIVDALLGIGVRPPLRDDWRSVIQAINTCGKPVLALDVPSGLDPDRGVALPAVRATATVSFIAAKQGLWLADGPEHCGQLFIDSLGVAEVHLVEPSVVLTDLGLLAQALRPRVRNSHKTQFGRVVVLGGGTGMAGAVRLAAEAALRVGAGLVTVASRAEHQSIIVGSRPELMFHAVSDASSVADAIAGADVIAIGPGLGREEWAKTVLQAAFAALRPPQQLILDADALNLVAAGLGWQRNANWVLTPHPGEAARLLAADTATVQADRMDAARRLCEQRGGIVVLKGAGTLVARSHEPVQLCAGGNPGMAVPGMGDVLTGCIAGVMAQCRDGGIPAATAVAAAVHLHAMAGDYCAAKGIRGILASDVAEALRTVLAPFP